MRFLVLILAMAVSACVPPPPPVIPIGPVTAEHCASAIQDAVDKMNAVDFNTDRKGEVKRFLAKARDHQAKGDFGKCIKFAHRALQAG